MMMTDEDLKETREAKELGCSWSSGNDFEAFEGAAEGMKV